MTKLEAYNEAKEICYKYINYRGDKRNLSYKRLQNMALNCYIGRMNSFGKQLGLPTYIDEFQL